MSEMRYDQAHRLARKIYEQFVVPFSRIHEVLELVLQAESDETRLRAVCARHEEAIKTQSQAYSVQAQEFESRRLFAEQNLAKLTEARGKLEGEILDLRDALGGLAKTYSDRKGAAEREHEGFLAALARDGKEESSNWAERVSMLRSEYEAVRLAIARLSQV